MSITRENIVDTLALEGSEQTKAAKALVTKAAREFKSVTAKSETVTLDASLATYVAEQTGIIPAKGTRVAGGEGGDMLTGAAYAALFGVQPSSVSMWRTLGYAVGAVGIDPNEESTSERMSTWRILAFKGAATNRAVSDAVYAEGATPESVRAAVESVRDGASGKVKSGARQGKPNKATGTEGDLNEAIKTDPVAVALAVIRDVLRPASAACDTEGWATVENALNALIQREVTIRNGKASKAAKATAEAALNTVVTPAPAEAEAA